MSACAFVSLCVFMCVRVNVGNCVCVRVLHACACVCHTCTQACVYMCVRLNERMFFCVSVCFHVCTCVCRQLCVRTCVHVCACVCLGVSFLWYPVCVCEAVCLAVCIYMCACAHKCVRPRACERGAVCVCDVAHVDIGKRVHVCAPLHEPVCAVGCGMVCARGDTRRMQAGPAASRI